MTVIGHSKNEFLDFILISNLISTQEWEEEHFHLLFLCFTVVYSEKKPP